MTETLSQSEQTLLERYYDGDTLSDAGVEEVDALLNRSAAARVFMAALEELTEAVCVVEE